jgi:hypothetical protein
MAIVGGALSSQHTRGSSEVQGGAHLVEVVVPAHAGVFRPTRKRASGASLSPPHARGWGLIRLVLAPWQTFREWRTMVLAITAAEHIPAHPHTTRPDTALSGGLGAASSSAAESAPGIATGPTPVAAGTPTPVPLPLTASASAPEPAAEPAPPAPPEAPIDAAATHTPRRLSKPAPRRTPVKAARASAGAVVDASPAPQRASGRPRPRQDPRIAVLAQYLARTHATDELTGEQVGQLLSMDITPRTGRRLLGAARELLDQHPTPPPRTPRQPAQRQRRTPTTQDRKYDTSRSGLGWAGLGLPHTPQNIDNPAAVEAIPAGQTR